MLGCADKHEEWHRPRYPSSARELGLRRVQVPSEGHRKNFLMSDVSCTTSYSFAIPCHNNI